MKRAEGFVPAALQLAAWTGPLRAQDLLARCDPGQFDFETTEGLPEPDQPFGQARAVDAVGLGLDCRGR